VFLLAPDQVERYFVAERLPVFLGFLLVGLMGWPRSSRARHAWLVAAAALYAAQLGFLCWKYREIGARLEETYRVLAKIPPGSTFACLRHWRSQAEGWIAPAAFLEYYRYVETHDARLPVGDPIVGSFRPVRTRVPLSSGLLCMSAHETVLRHYVCDGWWVGPGGFLLVAGQWTGLVEAVTKACGYTPVVQLPRLRLLRRSGTGEPPLPAASYESTRFTGTEAYVLVYQSPEWGIPYLEGYRLREHQGWAWLFEKDPERLLPSRVPGPDVRSFLFGSAQAAGPEP